jgi:hypothetical protein
MSKRPSTGVNPDDVIREGTNEELQATSALV